MTNKEAFSEAKKFIAGGVNSPVRAFGSVGGEPIIIDHGKGAYIYDIEGKKISRLYPELGATDIWALRR